VRHGKKGTTDDNTIADLTRVAGCSKRSRRRIETPALDANARGQIPGSQTPASQRVQACEIESIRHFFKMRYDRLDRFIGKHAENDMGTSGRRLFSQLVCEHSDCLGVMSDIVDDRYRAVDAFAPARQSSLRAASLFNGLSFRQSARQRIDRRQCAGQIIGEHAARRMQPARVRAAKETPAIDVCFDIERIANTLKPGAD